MTWNYAYTEQIWPSLITVFLLIGLAIFTRQRRFLGALPFTIGCLFAAMWALGSVLEIASLDLTTRIFWIKFQAVWQLPAITAETCFILEYAWPGRWLTRRNLALLSIAPLLLLVLVLTNAHHFWLWQGLTSDGSPILLSGPASWFFVAYAYGLGLIEIIVFTLLFQRVPQHRWPVAMFAASQIVVHYIYLLEMTGTFRTNFHLDIIAITIVFLMYAVALFGFRILDPVPLAHQAVIAQMREGMLVLDQQGHVIDLNLAAQAILGCSRTDSMGRPIQDLLPQYPKGDGDCLSSGPDQMEICLGAEPAERVYLLETSVLKDWRGMVIGRLLLLCDMTENKLDQLQTVRQQRAQAMLQEREQLARELHDCLGQVFAFVNAQGQAAQRLLLHRDIATANQYLDRLVEVTREADVDIRESILCLRVNLAELGFFPALERHLALLEKHYGLQTQLEVPGYFTEGIFEPLVEVQLLRILQEALTNVRKHAQARHVRIQFAVEHSHARITVQDDGLGFDPASSAARPAAQVGLRVMHERAEDVGGELHVDSTIGEGTCVTVKMPLVGVPPRLEDQNCEEQLGSTPVSLAQPWITPTTHKVEPKDA